MCVCEGRSLALERLVSGPQVSSLEIRASRPFQNELIGIVLFDWCASDMQGLYKRRLVTDASFLSGEQKRRAESSIPESFLGDHLCSMCALWERCRDLDAVSPMQIDATVGVG